MAKRRLVRDYEAQQREAGAELDQAESELKGTREGVAAARAAVRAATTAAAKKAAKAAVVEAHTPLRSAIRKYLGALGKAKPVRNRYDKYHRALERVADPQHERAVEYCKRTMISKYANEKIAHRWREGKRQAEMRIRDSVEPRMRELRMHAAMAKRGEAAAKVAAKRANVKIIVLEYEKTRERLGAVRSRVYRCRDLLDDMFSIRRDMLDLADKFRGAQARVSRQLRA